MTSPLTHSAILITLASLAAAQSVVVPNAYQSVRGTGGVNTLTREVGNPRTYMFGIPAAQLAGMPMGAAITGLSMRAQVASNIPATWPPSVATWASYDVTIGRASPLATWTGVFASHFSGTPETVRTGPMTIEAGRFTNNFSLPSPQPNSWGDFFWDFQKPYVYTGGDLAILFSHTGSNQSTFLFLDLVAPSPSFGVAFAATSYMATSGSSLAAIHITRIHYGYGTGCPATSSAVPNLVLTNDVVAPGSASFAVANGLANAPMVFVFGLQELSLQITPACTLLNNAVAVVPASLSNLGRIKVTGTFAAGGGLIYGQAFVLDTANLSLAGTLGAKLTVR